MNNFLKLKNISKHFNIEKKIKVLKNLSYNFNKGKMYALMGPSGSGKSTLLNLISLIDRPTLGSIKFNDDLVNFTNNKKNDIFRAKNIPKIVAEVPIITPIKKNILTIDLFKTPIDFKIAISLVLFLTKIFHPDIILNAATIIIKDNIINITFLSTFNAENKELFISAHV